MSAPYILSKTLDPLLALTIGTLAFWTRIRREETERWHLSHSSSSDSPNTSSSFSRITTAAHTAPCAVDVRLQQLDHAPTSSDTWNAITRRVWNLDWRKLDVKEIWRKKETFGIVDPNRK